MKIRSVALLATSALCCLNTATLNATNVSVVSLPKAPLAIFYSFDAPPPAVLVTEMQAELGRILAPAGLHVTWRSTDVARASGEDFPAIVVFRFHGQCAFGSPQGTEDTAPDPAGLALAQTQISDGHVLPFGTVNCDVVRPYIAPAARSLSIRDRNAALGRALARVSAHEIYHMLTQSEEHATQGIARSAHSRADLTVSTFRFAKTETTWLRNWVGKQPDKREQPTPATQSAEIHPDSDPSSVEPESPGFAGR
jgi:hypothetical protein